MKNLSLAINAILFVAVAALYYLHFSASIPQRTGEETTPTNLQIAYIKSDTVLKYYEYFKVNKDKLEGKGKRLDQDLKNRAQSLQNEFDSYQRNSSNLTMGQARAVEEDLGKKRQNLQLYQESLSQEMQMEQNKMTKDLYDRVTHYLKQYGKDKGLQVVLKNDASSDLLFGAESLDISNDVIIGLNELYKAEQAVPTAKKDTATVKK